MLFPPPKAPRMVPELLPTKIPDGWPSTRLERVPPRLGIPPSPRFHLFQIPRTLREPSGKTRVRALLKSLQRHWDMEDWRLEETPKGPRLLPQHEEDSPLRISISYAAPDAWLGIAWGAEVGIDAVRIHAFEELQEVADLYLPGGARALQTAECPEESFALAWARLESCLKMDGRPLQEGGSLPPCLTLSRRWEGFAIAASFRALPGFETQWPSASSSPGNGLLTPAPGDASRRSAFDFRAEV
jgi:hypothetical protein